MLEGEWGRVQRRADVFGTADMLARWLGPRREPLLEAEGTAPVGEEQAEVKGGQGKERGAGGG